MILDRLHVGPPKRDAVVHGSLHASRPSTTDTAADLGAACSSGARGGHRAARARGLLDLDDEVFKLSERLARMNPDLGGLPSLRRRIALLSLCFRASAGEAATEPPALRRLVRSYFDFFTDAMRFRSAVYFLHISKAGGTSFCAAAYENGCRDPNFGNGTSQNSWRWNCWARWHDDGPRWTVLPFQASPDGAPFQLSKFRKDPRNGWCVRINLCGCGSGRWQPRHRRCSLLACVASSGGP